MALRLERSLLRGGRMLCLAIIAAAGMAAHAPTANADALSWASGTTVPWPTNASSQPGVIITSISCPAAGNCAAIGSYQDASGATQGLLATETGGKWTTATMAQLPFNIDVTNPGVTLTSVSCASSGNCTAVGSYIDVHGLTQGLLLTETSGSWGKGREVIHPQGVASVATNPQIDLTSVSCPSATNCVAVGTYTDSNGYPQGLLETEINGVWSATQKNGSWSYTGAQAGLPGDASSEPNVALSSVSCGVVGRCVAVGSYVNSAHQQQGLLLTGAVSAGAWTFAPSAAGLPPGAAASPVAALTSVSCTGTSGCEAVGSYADANHHEQGLLLTEAGSSWGAGTRALLPADASANPDVSLTSVSCSTFGNCDAVGDYYTAASSLHGLMLTATGGGWGAGAEPSIPADAGSTSFVMLSSVSCFGTSECAATGSYADDSFASHPLLLSQSASGAWSAGVEPALPYPNTSPDANIEAVACAPGGGCTAIADYSDLANNQLAGAINGTLARAADPTLSLDPLPPVSEVGNALPAGDFSAVVSEGANESGEVTFTVFGPEDAPPVSCAAGGTEIGAVAVSGDGSYGPAQGFTPSTPGDYWWYANYGGDLLNSPAESACGASMGETVVQTPSLRVEVPSTTALNTVISPPAITAALSGAEDDAGGNVVFTVFGPQAAAPSDCSAAGTVVGTANVQGNGSMHPASGFTPDQVGDYWWYVSYSGDPSDPQATSSCGTGMAETVVKASPTLSLNAVAPTGTVGVSMSPSISGSVVGGVGATGTVTFSVFGPQASPPASCATPTIKVGSASVDAHGAYASAATFAPSAAGTYWWYATYGGDATNKAAASACGAQMPETVVSSPPTTPTVTSTRPAAATARIVAVSNRGKVLKVTLKCRAASHRSCAVQLRATTTEISPANARKRKTATQAKQAAARVVTIAQGTFAVAAGKARQVLLRLNRTGSELLASRGTLSVVLELHQARTVLNRAVTLHLRRTT